MGHLEEVGCSQENCDAKSRSPRRYVKPPALYQIGDSVRNWPQCRDETYRPEALSRFRSSLTARELDELEVIRFHLVHQVNRFQRLRWCGSEDMLSL